MGNVHSAICDGVGRLLMAQDQTVHRQQQEPQFWSQVTQWPLIPHNPPCLQTGDLECLWVFVPLGHCGGDISSSHHNPETHFPISMSYRGITSRLSLSQPLLGLTICFLPGGMKAIKCQYQVTQVQPSIKVSARSGWPVHCWRDVQSWNRTHLFLSTCY